MKEYFDIVFITTIPAFYKVKLFNAIADRCKLMVLFSGSKTGIRSNDFLQEKCMFSSKTLSLNPLYACIQVVSFLKKNQVGRVIVSGWDTIVSFAATVAHDKKTNGCIVESSCYESSIRGIKGYLKRALLKRVSTAFVSGESQKRLLNCIGFSGTIVETGGCGILNYVDQPQYASRESVKSFLYVGQIIEKKGVSLLVSVFNRNPQWQLTIIGDGIQRTKMEEIAKDNVHFLGAIDNSELSSYYKESDVFILPSLIEPWGLVVEEALNNGTPVIVSDRVGCADSLVLPNNAGLVFESNNNLSLESCIKKICDISLYNQLRKNVSSIDFKARTKHQVDAFIKGGAE